MQIDKNTLKSISDAVETPIYTEFRPTRKCLHDISEVRKRLQKQERKRGGKKC